MMMPIRSVCLCVDRWPTFLKMHGRMRYVQTLARCLASKGVQRVTPWPAPGRYYRETLALEYSVAHVDELLGWRPTYDFSSGVALTWTWLEFARLLEMR